jgi:hypothetical protein
MAQWWKPYEPLMERKPISSKEALMGLIADELCEICESFPPAPEQIDWQSDQFKKRFVDKLIGMPKIDFPMASALHEILSYELEFKPEATAALFRNQTHAKACPTESHREAIHFLWPILLETLYTRKEDCQGHLRRADLAPIATLFLEKYKQKQARILL